MCTSRGARAFVLLVLAAALAIPNPAAAVTIFFSDSVLAGFDPADVALAGLTPAGSATSAQQIVTSNSGEAGLLQVVASSAQPQVIERPQSMGMDPSPALPYIANIGFVVTANQTLENVILAFTGPTLPYLAGIDNVGIAVENQIQILQYSSLSPMLELPAVFLGNMNEGTTSQVTLQIHVTGLMPGNPEVPGSFVLPELGMTAFAAAGNVPEPPLALLLLLAGAAWGIVRRPVGPRRRAVALGTLAALAAVPLPSFARDEAEVLAIRARTLAERGSCEDAARVLDRIGPRSAQGDFWLGRCYVAERNYVAAIPLLERASSSGDPALEAQLYLGIAHYHLGDLGEARQYLANARLGGVSDPQLDLYEGVILLDAREFEPAAAAFGRARESGASDVEPVASFYEAVALRRAGRGDQADLLFARVADAAAGTRWADRARRATEPVNLLGPPRRWAQITVGGGYDSNVVFKGKHVDLPSDVSGRNALFGAWSAEAGFELARTAHMQLGVISGYAGATYNSLKEFNPQAPSIGGWMDYVFDETTAARARYDFSFSWAGHDSFASGHTVDSVLFHEWGEAGRSELEAGWYWLDYKYPVPGVAEAGTPCVVCGPPGVDEAHRRNRDGYGLVAGLTHVVPLGAPNSHARAGYRYHRYFSVGNDYSYQGHEIHVGFDGDLPAGLSFDARASYTYQPYAHPSSYPDPDDVIAGVPYSLSGKDRRDNIFRFDLSLARQLSARTEIEARYTLIDNASNTDVFDYNRQIFGLYLTARFQ